MQSKSKKSVAVFAASGCRGCEHAILDIHFQVQSLSRWADIVFWPYVLGSGEEALRALDSIDVCLFTGAIQTLDERQAALTLREKTDLLVACGACAAFGGMPGLANLNDQLAPSAEADMSPESEETSPEIPELPKLQSKVLALSQIVPIDYIIPGCQPTQSLLWAGIQALVCGPQATSKLSFTTSRLPAAAAQAVTAGILPPKGFHFCGEKAVCASCSRVKEEKKFKTVVRPYQQYEESGRCLLEQGLICMGISTREGCGGICTGVGQPCRGCFGKPEEVFDPGAKMVSAISSTFDSEEKTAIEDMVEAFKDLSGTFYRYTTPTQCALSSKE
jgi:F420-non-reducing hydrogenase small subunit